MKQRLLQSFILALACYLLPLSAKAQFWPPNQSEQDPCGAILLCGYTFSTPNSYQGIGLTVTPGTCAGEGNSMWLKVSVIGGGNIIFTISPSNIYDDYDFLVYNGTTTPCGSLGAANVIRCNANNNNPGSNINGQVGLNAISGLTTVAGGTFGSSYCQQIAALPGDVYYICINNFGNYAPNPTGPFSGFTIDFTGSSAIFGGSTVPAYNSITPSCNNANNIQVIMNTPVKCNSIAANGSDFQLIPAGASVSAATGVGCTPTGTATTLNLTFSSALPAGNYVLKPKTGTDGNTLLNLCDVGQPLTDAISFTVVTPLVVNAGADTVTCGDSVQLNAIVTGGGAVNGYVWTPSTGLSNPNILNPTASPGSDITYTLTVTPSALANCAVADAVNVGVLQGFDITSGDTTVCKGITVPLFVSGDSRYNYLWTPITYLSNPVVANSSATPDTTITYTLVASYPGCPDTMQHIKITVEPVPSVFAGNDRTLCYGDTLRMQPQVTPTWFPNYKYSWTPATSFDQPTLPDPIFYAYNNTTVTLTVTTPIGCTASDDVEYTVVPPDFVTVSADTALCPRDTASLHAEGALSYEWLPATYADINTGTDIKVSPHTSTMYYVIGTSPLGCRDTQQVYVRLYPAATISLPDSVRIFPGESYQIDPGGNGLYFAWFPPTGLTDDRASNPVATPSVNTRYFVTATTEHGCTTSDSLDVLVNLETLLAMPNAFVPGNGENNVFKITKRGIAQLKSFQIFDRWGQKVYESSDIDAGWNGRFNDKPQPMGVYVYMVEAVTNTGQVFKKHGNVTLLR